MYMQMSVYANCTYMLITVGVEEHCMLGRFFHFARLKTFVLFIDKKRWIEILYGNMPKNLESTDGF